PGAVQGGSTREAGFATRLPQQGRSHGVGHLVSKIPTDTFALAVPQVEALVGVGMAWDRDRPRAGESPSDDDSEVDRIECLPDRDGGKVTFTRHTSRPFFFVFTRDTPSRCR